MKDLSDASIDRETERKSIPFVENYPRISRGKKCLSRNAGGWLLVDLNVESRTPSHNVANPVADRLEKEYLLEFPGLFLGRICPHCAPGIHKKRVAPVKSPDGEFCHHLVTSPWFQVETITIEGKEFVENQYKDAEKKR